VRANPVDFLKAQPRLISSAFVGALVYLLLPSTWWHATRMLVAWDCATASYLLLAMTMMARSNIDRIRHRADRQDEGQMIILALTVITALVSLAGVMAQMAAAKGKNGSHEWQHVALAGMTVFLSWTFLHTIFAVHYAHEFYAAPEDSRDPGLEFPGHEPPDYWDFIYYSFVIGTACATADVNITSRVMRRLTAIHCVVAFFFNTTILALTVNIGAGFI
jgi:uncharacterized membrane protein